MLINIKLKIDGKPVGECHNDIACMYAETDRQLVSTPICWIGKDIKIAAQHRIKTITLRGTIIDTGSQRSFDVCSL